ncbi:hypothetical protein N9F62_00585 [bacterium]|nr:hypothetical protein [bacterium]
MKTRITIVYMSGPLGVDRRRFAASTPAAAMWTVTSGGYFLGSFDNQNREDPAGRASQDANRVAQTQR